jgi:hypothetical protein
LRRKICYHGEHPENVLQVRSLKMLCTSVVQLQSECGLLEQLLRREMALLHVSEFWYNPLQIRHLNQMLIAMSVILATWEDHGWKPVWKNTLRDPHL